MATAPQVSLERGKACQPAGRLRVCMIGTFPQEEGGYTNAGELLRRQFLSDGNSVVVASRRRRRLAKLFDILATLILKRHAYDVVTVEVYSTSALWYARLTVWLCGLLGRPVVAVLHGGGLPALAGRGDARLKGVLAGASVVVSPSAYLKREVGERLGINVLVIPNPVDIGRLPRRIRKEARPRLFWLRAFHETYLPEVAIRAAALLRPAFDDLRLTMAGPDKDGSLRRCKALAGELGLGGAVEFTGMIDKARIGKIGNVSDVFINTSAVDNSPLSVSEAMSMGLCVVTTDVGGIPDLLTDGRDALFVEPGSAPEIAAAVSRIVSDPQLTQSLSRNALESSTRFSIETVARRWYELLDGLLSGPSPSRGGGPRTSAGP